MDKALKQRLVGAIVLIGLAVIFLPMLLSGAKQQREAQVNRLELPPKPDAVAVEARRFPVTEQARSEQQNSTQVAIETRRPTPSPTVVDTSAAADSREQPGSPSSETQQTEKDTEPPASTVVKNDPPVTPAASTPPATTSGTQQVISRPAGTGRYLVQVASFSNPDNANRVVKSLQDLGLPTLWDSVANEAGTMHRVRLGPYTSTAAAEQALAKLKPQFPDLRPRLVDLQPTQDAPVTQPSDALIRWVVQLGSFSSKDNATKLADRLRAANYNAFVDTVSSASGAVYKVKVGPELERSGALALRDTIKTKLKLDGLVVSY